MFKRAVVETGTIAELYAMTQILQFVEEGKPELMNKFHIMK
jgi:hypothetical protein